MITISITEAVARVRKNLDELDTNSSEMFAEEYEDNMAIDAIIRKTLPEAINTVSLAAPVTLLEGKDMREDVDSVSIEDGVLSFSLPEDSRFLRLVAFKASDSGIVVSDLLPEASPEGRKQLNQYIRGRFDRPRLVHMQGVHTGPAFKYYSLRDEYTEPADAIDTLLAVQEQFCDENAGGYDASRRLRQNINDYLTALVMDTYADQRSQIYHQRAFTFPNI